MKTHPPTRDYVAPRTAEGMSKRDIMCCLKRYVAREVYHQLVPAPPRQPAAITLLPTPTTQHDHATPRTAWLKRSTRAARGDGRDLLATGYEPKMRDPATTLSPMARHVREAAALFALLRARPKGASWGSIASEVELAGSASAVLNAGDDGALFAAIDAEGEIERAAKQLAEWIGEGYRFVTVLDDEYPARLRDIREVPPFLFYEGDLRGHDVGMSVVGSRSASPWGLAFAAEAARLLVSEGLSVIAGLAAGIDTAAHRAALDSEGRTVAFIGTGISQTYPRENAALQREIAERGLVLSQFYPDAPPTKHTFPMRNASMSGYGLATIVVEAGEHSGTRIQARLAGQHGRPVILTDRVAARTTWGQALVGKPSVHVVANLGELSAALSEVREASGRLRNALEALTVS